METCCQAPSVSFPFARYLSSKLQIVSWRIIVAKKNTLTLTHICIYTNSCHVHQSFALLFLNVHSVWSLLALSTNESFAVWIVMAHPVEWYDSWWSSILTSRQKPSIIKIVRMRETCFCICFTIIQHPTSSIIFGCWEALHDAHNQPKCIQTI